MHTDPALIPNPLHLAGDDAPRDRNPLPSHPPADDTALDAYSRAVIGVVETAGPAVIALRGPRDSPARPRVSTPHTETAHSDSWYKTLGTTGVIVWNAAGF